MAPVTPQAGSHSAHRARITRPNNGGVFIDCRLSIELVPKPCWSLSLCNRLVKSAWDELREEVFRKAGQRCEIRGGAGPLHCHEICKYDDLRHSQKLIGLIAICKLCHRVKHLGHASILAEQGIISLDRVARHYMKVNHVRRAEYDADVEMAFARWKIRSQHEWSTDFGKWTHLVETRSKRKYAQNP